VLFWRLGQGHQRFTPEYVIKNQTKPHLRNYSFLHSHFLTSSQTKLLIPWTFFNVQYIIRYSEDSRKAMSRRRHRGFGSLHATALASKMRQQSDWTGKNYLFNIDCRLFLNPRYGERSTSTYPVPPESWCQCWPIFYFQGYHHGLCSVQPKQVTQAAFVVPIYLALITFNITWWNIYSFA